MQDVIAAGRVVSASSVGLVLQVMILLLAVWAFWRVSWRLVGRPRPKLWRVVPFGWCPVYAGEEAQGLVVETDGGRVLEVSLQCFVAVGRRQPMRYWFGRREVVARPLYWVRAFWSRPDPCFDGWRIRLGLGVVGLRYGVCPDAIPMSSVEVL